MDKLLLKPTEVAELLGVSRAKAYDLIRCGEVPGVMRLGKSVRVSREALEAWVREQVQAATDGHR